jgi:hypothetical protein
MLDWITLSDWIIIVEAMACMGIGALLTLIIVRILALIGEG